MIDTIKLAGMVKESFVDGPGIRFAVFTQGCAHACHNCQNPETWDFNGGCEYDINKILASIDQNPLLDGITLTGGEPFNQPQACFVLAEAVKKRGHDVVLFTGFTFEELTVMAEVDHWVQDLLNMTDILIDGRYEDSLRDLTLLFRGSSNQRTIDMNLTRKRGELVFDNRYM